MTIPPPFSDTPSHSIPSDPLSLAPAVVTLAASRSSARQIANRHQARSIGGFEAEGDHRLEKLEFALAVALTRGDQGRAEALRDQITALGGNQEEPGT